MTTPWVFTPRARALHRGYTPSVNKPYKLPERLRVDQVREGDGYELSNGEKVECAPAGGQHGGANLVGALPLATDPAVQEAGVDVGYALSPDTMRAPDIAVGNVPGRPGWVPGAPPLAVEYADRDQDEEALETKIGQLLAAGTKYIWVVRLAGPRRVEVFEPGREVVTMFPGQVLTAPGVLKNAVAVEALYDPVVANRAALTNLLQREGYENLDAVRAEGLAPIVARKLGRPLTPEEQTALRTKLAVVGPELVGDAVLDLRGDELARWLVEPEAP